MQDMGKRIKALRTARDWSQEETAAQLGIKQPSLSDIENGITKSLSGKTVAMVCRVFHTTAEYVCFGSDAQDDPEMPLIEAELVHINRSLAPDRRRAVLDAARGIFRGRPNADQSIPFSGRVSKATGTSHANNDSDFDALEARAPVKPKRRKEN